MKLIRGFTLTEMLMVVAIAALLLTIGIPAFSEQIRKYKLDAAKNALMQLAQQARMTAVNESITTALCGASDGKQCDAGKRWNDYVIAFRDLNRNQTIDADDTIIFQHALDNAHLSGTQARMAFNPSGAGYMGSWTYCPLALPSSAETFKLVQSLGGRVRSEAVQGSRCD